MHVCNCPSRLRLPVGWVVVLLAASVARPSAGEEVLVVEQSYNLIQQGKEGPQAKDITQKMYLSAGWIRIDEFGGQSKQPTETFLIDLKKKVIVDLDNENLTKVVESFDQRRERIEERKRTIRKDLDNLPDGAQKTKTAELYRALLDDHRAFRLVQEKDAPKKQLAGVECSPVKVVAENEPDYTPLTAYLHPDVEVSYDTAEVLYLLQIIGARMRDFLNKNKSQFRRLPLEMTLDLAAGGSLHLTVREWAKVDREKLDRNLNVAPEVYREKPVVRPPPPPTKKTQPD